MTRALVLAFIGLFLAGCSGSKPAAAPSPSPTPSPSSILDIHTDDPVLREAISKTCDVNATVLVYWSRPSLESEVSRLPYRSEFKKLLRRPGVREHPLLVHVIKRFLSGLDARIDAERLDADCRADGYVPTPTESK